MKTQKYFLQALSLFILLFIVASAQGQTSQAENIQTQINAVENNLLPTVKITGEAPWNIKNRMSHYNVSGVSIAVIDNFEVVWAKGYGVADAKKKNPVTTSTLFQAASISKTVNAVAVLQLMEQQKINLNEDINTYLKSWKFPYTEKSNGKKITTKHLLSHTAGLSTSGFDGYMKAKKVPNLTQILDGKKTNDSEAVRSISEPGLAFQYSGGGILITQQMIEDISKSSYESYISNNILQPLGMNNSLYALNKNLKQKDLASGHWWNGKRLKNKYNIYPELAAAGLWTTPTDLAKFVIALQKSLSEEQEALISKPTAELMFTPVLDNHITALGTFIRDKKGTLYFDHSGSNEGFTCHYYGSMEDGKGVIVMTNAERYELIPEIINSVASVYEWKNFHNPNPRTIVEVSEADLKPLVGTYEFESGNKLTIGNDKDILFILNNENNQLDLYPESNRSFFFRQMDEQIEFIEENNSIALRYHRNGKEYKATRTK